MDASEKLQVVIVDDIAETRENIRKLLQFEADIEVVGVARTGREGIEVAKDTSPDVILMDINMPDMDGIAATEEIRKLVPFSQIVILSVQGDPNYMRRAMLAGARDFLTKPPMVDELLSAIRRAGGMAREAREKESARYPQVLHGTAPLGLATPIISYGKVISIFSPKGGVGCTTLAVNIAVTLHNEETPVVLVDGDLQFGDVAVFLNERAKNSIIDLAQSVDDLDPEIIGDVLITHRGSGIKILAAPTRPEYAENINGEQFIKIIEYLRRLFSYIIIDTSSTLTDIVLGVLDISDVQVLITTQDIPCINNIRLFLDLADELGLDRQQILFIMNQWDRRIAIAPDNVGENLKQEIVTVIPMDPRVVIPSVNRGIPLMMDSKSRPIARAFLDLAEAIRERVSKPDGQPSEIAARSVLRR